MLKTITSISLACLLLPAGAAMAQRRTSSSTGSSPRLSTETPSNETAKPKPVDAAYRMLLNSSMFSRDRRVANAGSEQPVVPPPVTPAEAYLVFRGTAVEDGKVIGFVEDTRDNSTLRVQTGEPLASGLVSAMTADRLTYSNKEGTEKRAIALGFNLRNNEVEPPGSDSSSSSSQVASSSFPSSPGRIGFDDARSMMRNNYQPGGFDRTSLRTRGGDGSFSRSDFSNPRGGFDSSSPGGFRQRGGGTDRFGSGGGSDRFSGGDRFGGSGGSGGYGDSGGGRRNRQRGGGMDFGG